MCWFILWVLIGVVVGGGFGMIVILLLLDMDVVGGFLIGFGF